MPLELVDRAPAPERGELPVTPERFAVEVIDVLHAFRRLPWYARIAVPMLGGGLAGALGAIGAKLKGGHGVGEVMEAVALGHKIARQAAKIGSPVVKYGEPIASATRDISVGQHVHVHNVASNRARKENR